MEECGRRGLVRALGLVLAFGSAAAPVHAGDGPVRRSPADLGERGNPDTNELAVPTADRVLSAMAARPHTYRCARALAPALGPTLLVGSLADVAVVSIAGRQPGDRDDPLRGHVP